MGGDIIGITYIICIFVVVAVFFVKAIRHFRSQRALMVKTGKRLVGVIRKLDYQWLFSPLRTITIFEIHTDNGEIFNAGVEAVNSDLDDGVEIEFWLTEEIILEKPEEITGENRYGGRFYRSVQITYFRLEEYTVLSKPPGTTIYTKANKQTAI